MKLLKIVATIILVAMILSGIIILCSGIGTLEAICICYLIMVCIVGTLITWEVI